MNIRQLLLATALYSLLAAPPGIQAQERETATYEDPAPLEVSRLLPEPVLRSAQHQVTGVRALAGNRVIFDIESEISGNQQVESIPLTLIRIKEILTLTQARSQLVQDNPTLPDDDRGKIKVELSDPFTNVAKVVGQFGSNVGQTLDEFGSFPGPEGQAGQADNPSQIADPVFASHRRNIASQLGLDIYSTNLQVQFFLDTTATARIDGQPRAGINTISLNQPVEVSIDGGRIDSRIRSSLLNQDRSELFQRNKGLLREAGIDDELIREFLDNTVTSPSHKTTLVEYLEYLKGASHRDALIKAALAADSEIDALATIAMARMFAHYNESWSPIKELIPAGHLTLGISQDGTLLVALPFDILFWNRETENIFEALSNFTESKGVLKKAVLLNGAATTSARESLEQLGFQTLERFLFKR